MQACNAIMSDFLGAKKAYFVVPVYQRNYDWLDGNCRQLFFDIEKIIETGEEHFIGTVVFKASSIHERALIDGQQRLTSCTLLLKALRDETEDEKLKEVVRVLDLGEQAILYSEVKSQDCFLGLL